MKPVGVFLGVPRGSGPFFFSIPLASEQKRDRHVGFMDRAKLLDFRNARFGGQGLGNTLVPFLRFVLLGKRDRCLWLGSRGIVVSPP